MKRRYNSTAVEFPIRMTTKRPSLKQNQAKILTRARTCVRKVNRASGRRYAPAACGYAQPGSVCKDAAIKKLLQSRGKFTQGCAKEAKREAHGKSGGVRNSTLLRLFPGGSRRLRSSAACSALTSQCNLSFLASALHRLVARVPLMPKACGHPRHRPFPRSA